MALARLSGRFRSPGSRSDRRRRARAGAGDPPSPEEISPQQRRERRRLYWSIGIGVFLLLVIFGVVVVGYYREFYRPPRVWAGSVNNVEFTMGDLVQRIRVLQGVNRYDGGRVDLSTVPFEYLENLIDVEILRQAALGLGIAPQEETIDGDLRRRFGPAVPEGQEVDPGQLDREFQNNYQTFLTATGLTDPEFRVIVEEELTEFSLFLQMTNDVETIQEQVEVRWIRLPTNPNEAGSTALREDQVAQRLEVEPFEVVAREVGRSAGYADAEGYVGWVPRGAFPNLDPLLYGDEEGGVVALNPGERSRPFYAVDATYIVEKLSGLEERELSDGMRLKLSLQLTEDWKANARSEGLDNGTVKMKFNSVLYGWVADQVFVTAPRVDQAGQTGR